MKFLPVGDNVTFMLQFLLTEISHSCPMMSFQKTRYSKPPIAAYFQFNE